jgi:hypothetical protein
VHEQILAGQWRFLHRCRLMFTEGRPELPGTA